MESERLQNLMREIGMQNTGTGMRAGLSSLGKLGWETWLEERTAKLAERRMRTRLQVAQQMSTLVDGRASLSATIHRADLQDLSQAYELGEAQRNPRSLLPSSPPLPQRAISSAPPQSLITDEQIEGLALRAVLGFETENWGASEWNVYWNEIRAMCPENVAREVHRRVNEMSQELS